MKTIATENTQRDELLAKLQQEDFSLEKARLVSEHGMSPAFADKCIAEWQRYLVMLALHKKKVFIVSKPVDLVGHEHMLNSRHLRQTQKTLGMEIQHAPTRNDAERASLLPLYLNDSIPTFEALFGLKADEEVWTRNACVCGYNGGDTTDY